MSLASWERGAGVDPAVLFGTVSADIPMSAQRGCTHANHPDVVESDRGRARSEQHRRENFFQILAVEFYFVLDPETIRAVRLLLTSTPPNTHVDSHGERISLTRRSTTDQNAASLG